VRTYSFTGVVVSCETRFQTEVERAIPTHFDASWVVTIDVETAEEGAPARAGSRVSFLFHSPTHVFFDRAEKVAGRRWRFAIENLGAARAGSRWSNLSATELITSK
jgi:hypothetical protein